MISLWSVLTIAHLFGLALGVGAATVKLTLLLRCRSNHDFVPVFLKITRPVTRLIILGLILLTLSGIGWILVGMPVTKLLLVKICLVLVIWILGPVIDNVIEPKFKKLAPEPGTQVSPDFVEIQKRYLMLETVATSLFYVITVMGVLL